MNKKKGIIGVAVLVALAGVAWFYALRDESKDSIRIETAQVTRSSLSHLVTATGTVEPVTEVEVGTQVSGIIDKLYVDYNDEVKAGQLIAEMDKVNLKAELSLAEAQLASSKCEYDYQQKNYTRNNILYTKKLISDSDYETALYTYEKAKAAYEQSVASMSKVRRNLEYATITSPIDGVVIDRAVEEGQTVAAGFETPTLYTIAADLTKMQVVADVDEADIGSVANGQRVTFTVDAYPNDCFEGVVSQIRLGDSNSTSSTTSSSSVVTYEVVVTADNPDLKLKPRLTANISIYTMERNQVLTVPNKALRFVPDVKLLMAAGVEVVEPKTVASPPQKVVWLKQDGRLVPKIVTVGISSTNETEIIAGLGDDDVVVVDLSNASAAMDVNPSTAERSPFMPTPPGNKKRAK